MIEPSALQSDFHEHLIPNVPYAGPPDKQFMTKPRWWRSERAHEGLLPSRVPRSACPSMEPGPRFAPRLRHADYSALLGVVSLLVCSPACLPATRKVLLRALKSENAAGWPHAPGDASTVSVSIASDIRIERVTAATSAG